MVKKILNILFFTEMREKLSLLHIIFPKISEYKTSFDKTSFQKCAKKYLIRLVTVFTIDLIVTQQYLKTKTKSYEGKTNTNFHNKIIPEEILIVLF